MEPSQEFKDQLTLFRYLKDQREMLQGQMEFVNVTLNNVMNTRSTVENLKKGVKEDDEILVPIGGYVNIKASIKETKKVLLNVSQDVVIEKDLDGAIEFLDKLIERLKQQVQFLSDQIQTSDVNLQRLSQNIQQGFT